VSVLPISEKTIEYAREVESKLSAAGFRAHLDDRNEKIQAKIRDAQMQKIPYMLVVGGKEAAAGTVAVRHRAKGDLGPQPLADFISTLRGQIESHANE
jgi:threonyl-tRNA synthetase